nr:unnamed protein product [Callosobruchus chinensis]
MRVPWTSISSHDAVVEAKVKLVTMDDLDREQLSMLKSTFDAFDVDRKGYIEADMIGTVMDMLGTHVSADELDKIITEIDEDSNGEISFEEFANLAARFLVEDDEDTEAIQVELKGAFRLYDREGNGFITTDVLREILRELDEKLSEDDLDNIIDEIDTDGSGTVDWEVTTQYDADDKLPLDYQTYKKLGISKDQLKTLKSIFDSFDLEAKGEISVDMIGQILDMLGHRQSPEELAAVVKEIDEDGNGVMSFEEFANLAAKFLIEEEEDTEAILRELKDAFRLYDRDGLGYITVDLLRDILKELEPTLSPSDLNEMIKEIDTDNSGTVDWEGELFC